MGSRIDIDDNLVIERYDELKNLKKVAKSFGVSLRPIKRILIKNNIELTNRRFTVDYSYFNIIDSEEKAYWLGFLFADGCVRETKTGSQVVLKLSIKDENHLIKFKNDLNSEHKIFYYRNKTKTKNGTDSFSDNCVIRINSCEMVRDLIEQGCSPRKTFTIDKPNIDEKYYKDFIRGYYDGDGNFFYSEDTKLSVITNIEGEEFIQKYGFKCPLGVKGRNSDNKLYREKIGWEVSQPLYVGLKKTYQWIKTQVDKKKLETKWIYESPDGGKTVYKREIMSSERHKVK